MGNGRYYFHKNYLSVLNEPSNYKKDILRNFEKTSDDLITVNQFYILTYLTVSSLVDSKEKSAPVGQKESIIFMPSGVDKELSNYILQRDTYMTSTKTQLGFLSDTVTSSILSLWAKLKIRNEGPIYLFIPIVEKVGGEDMCANVLFVDVTHGKSFLWDPFSFFTDVADIKDLFNSDDELLAIGDLKKNIAVNYLLGNYLYEYQRENPVGIDYMDCSIFSKEDFKVLLLKQSDLGSRFLIFPFVISSFIENVIEANKTMQGVIHTIRSKSERDELVKFSHQLTQAYENLESKNKVVQHSDAIIFYPVDNDSTVDQNIVGPIVPTEVEVPGDSTPRYLTCGPDGYFHLGFKFKIPENGNSRTYKTIPSEEGTPDHSIQSQSVPLLPIGNTAVVGDNGDQIEDSVSPVNALLIEALNTVDRRTKESTKLKHNKIEDIFPVNINTTKEKLTEYYESTFKGSELENKALFSAIIDFDIGKFFEAYECAYNNKIVKEQYVMLYEVELMKSCRTSAGYRKQYEHWLCDTLKIKPIDSKLFCKKRFNYLRGKLGAFKVEPVGQNFIHLVFKPNIVKRIHTLHGLFYAWELLEPKFTDDSEPLMTIKEFLKMYENGKQILNLTCELLSCVRKTLQ